MAKYNSIFIKNIYYMLSYAFSALKQQDDDKIATEEFDNLHNLLAAILSRGIGYQLKQGLYREYINRKEDLPVMRGKIDIYGTIRNRVQRKRRLTCEFDELSENNLLNRILKTTSMLLLRHGEVETEYKNELKKEMLFFSGIDEIDPLNIRWSSVRFQRNNRTYQVLIGVCRLIIEGLLLTTESGEYMLSSFLDEKRMCHLYEKFILEYYIKEHPEIVARAEQIKWALDDDEKTLLPIMQTDVMLSKDGNVLIIDAKYYSRITQVQYDSHTLHSNNLYQIFTYVKNKEIELKDRPHKVSGMLLYAKTEEDILPDNTYHMSGNEISVQTLDLNRDFSEIKQQLDEILYRHFDIIRQ